MQKSNTLSKYFTVAVIAQIVDLALLVYFASIASFYYLLAATIAFIGSATVNFLLCYYWAFAEYKYDVMRQFTQTLLISAVGLLITLLVMWAMVTYAGMAYYVAKGVAITTSFLWNYLMRKAIVFTPAYDAANEDTIAYD